MSRIESLLARERAVVSAGLTAIAGLAWIYLWGGAGMGMSALEMTRVSLFPHLQPDPGGAMEAPWPVVVIMWWVMMVAMMTPSATPLVLLYGIVLRRHAEPGRASAFMLVLLAGYLSAWLVFALAASALQKVLEPSGLISSMMLWSRSHLLSAVVLAGAGAYQLSPLKRACLVQCRHPVRFLTRHWRPGMRGSFLLGIRHGIYCVGCCWILMALLFVGGVMNLAWVAALTLLVLGERVSPASWRMREVSAAVLLAWALVTLLVGPDAAAGAAS